MEHTEAVARDAAIESALAHAAAVERGWPGLAFIFLMDFAGTERAADRPWTCELLRAMAEKAGIPAAPDDRAWGGVVRSAARMGLIEQAGWTKSVGRHKGDARTWQLKK